VPTLTLFKSVTRTNIAPDRSPVERVVRPNNGVNKRVKACQCSPNHVIACSGVPCFQVPGEGNEDQDETKSGEDWEEGIEIAGHDLLRWWGEMGGNGIQKTAWLLVYSMNCIDIVERRHGLAQFGRQSLRDIFVTKILSSRCHTTCPYRDPLILAEAETINVPERMTTRPRRYEKRVCFGWAALGNNEANTLIRGGPFSFWLHSNSSPVHSSHHDQQTHANSISLISLTKQTLCSPRWIFLLSSISSRLTTPLTANYPPLRQS